MAAPSSSSHFHAKLGGLRHRLLLDTPQRVYYGNDVPVTGHVLLKHLPLLRALPHSPLTAELFGPLRVDVVLRGSARINHLDESRAECIPLCREVVNIHHAPLRISPDAERKLPFSLRFPIESVDREPLPPTIDVRRRADTWGTLGTTNLSAVLKTAVTVQYTLETQVSMPGIEVDVQAADPPTGVPLYYDRLRLPASTAGADQTLTSDYSHPFTAQNDALRPESEQPQGLRSKTKALLKPLDLPKFVFEASFIGIPRHAYIGQPLSFAVTVVPDDESSTTKIHPNVFLDSCTITLVAHTTGTQPPTIELLRTKEANFSSAIPFGQDYGWTKAVDIGLLSWVPSTFAFRNISRTYKLRIESSFSVGTQKIKTSRDVPLTIHPPIEIETSRSSASEDPHELPSYQEANQQDVGALGDVPSYEQATSTLPYDGPAPSYTQQP